MEKPLFGVSGFPPNFFKSDYKKKRSNIFEWLKSLGLEWVELQSTYGVKMKKDQALEYRSLAEEHGIGVSVHAPYYISLASSDKEIVERSKINIEKSFELASWLGAKRVIFHPGYSNAGKSREEGMKMIIDGLNSIRNRLPIQEGISIYPEIGGKKNQLGSIEEIIEICKNVDYALPCLDLAHLHAREDSSLNKKDDFIKMFEKIENGLGKKYLEKMHIHMYPVEGNLTGEKIHKAFGDKDASGKTYGPDPDGFVGALKEMKLDPIVVCEARDTQDEGALLMKSRYLLI